MTPTTLMGLASTAFQGLNLLNTILGSTNNSSSRNNTFGTTDTSTSGGQSSITQGSNTVTQSLGGTYIGTPTGWSTLTNQGSVNWANLLSMGSNLFSNLMSGASQSSAKQYNSAEAAQSRAWAEKMRATAYQDTMKDMKAAGLNPILAAQNGATSTPGGAQASAAAMHYQQQSAQAAAAQAVYQYGHNTAETFNWLHSLAMTDTVKSNSSTYQKVHSAMQNLAESSANQVETYATLADAAVDGLSDIGNKAKEYGGKVADKASDMWNSAKEKWGAHYGIDFSSGGGSSHGGGGGRGR